MLKSVLQFPLFAKTETKPYQTKTHLPSLTLGHQKKDGGSIFQTHILRMKFIAWLSFLSLFGFGFRPHNDIHVDRIWMIQYKMVKVFYRRHFLSFWFSLSFFLTHYLLSSFSTSPPPSLSLFPSLSLSPPFLSFFYLSLPCLLLIIFLSLVSPHLSPTSFPDPY